MNRSLDFRIWYALPAIAILAVAVWPLVNGSETLFMRDVLSSHFPLKAAAAQVGAPLKVPLLDPFRAGGQPLLGNPNALPLYPDNILYRFAHPLWALNAHFWLHLFLAPFSMFWLGRSFGLSRPASWAAGLAFASSGFFLSLFNLYNLIAGAALAPAFIASCRRTAAVEIGSPARARSCAASAMLWTLLLLAGDPLFAALAGLLAASSCWKLEGCTRRGLGRLAGSVALGTTLAAPMLVELIRILPLSYRGYWQYSPAAALAQSWDPRAILEQLLPFFFGTPDYLFWGSRFFGDNPPLLFSLYPGLLVLALVAASGKPIDFGRLWAWSVVGSGVFLSLGAWNPAARLLYSLPGFRYPVKCWLLVAIGLSLLAGFGFERYVMGYSRALSRALGLLLLFYFGVWSALTFLPEPLLRALLAFGPPFPFASEHVRWAGLSLFSWIIAAVLYLLVRRGGSHAPPSLLLVHLVTQLFFLQPLRASDESVHYRARPPVLDFLPIDATLVHGQSQDLFGAVRIRLQEVFPDQRFHWSVRSFFEQLHPFSGIQWGRRYEFNHSPEGLDSFFTISLRRALQNMDDSARIRLLAASGVDILLLSRDLAPDADGLASLLTRIPASFGPELRVYEISNPAAPVQLVADIELAPNMNTALELLTAEDFDPRASTVLPGGRAHLGSHQAFHRGEASIVADEWPTLEIEVESPQGGVVLVQRTFHSYYHATVDGQATPVEVANAHRVGIRVDRGRHRVRLFVDSRPTHFAWAGSALALVTTLALLATGLRRPSSRIPDTGSTESSR